MKDKECLKVTLNYWLINTLLMTFLDHPKSFHNTTETILERLGHYIWSPGKDSRGSSYRNPSGSSVWCLISKCKFYWWSSSPSIMIRSICIHYPLECGLIMSLSLLSWFFRSRLSKRDAFVLSCQWGSETTNTLPSKGVHVESLGKQTFDCNGS